MNNRRRGHGQTCEYCKRRLESVRSQSRLAATKDHVVPKSKGGRMTVWACRQCNSIKGNMEPDDWRAFMEDFPEWWKNPLFRNHGRGRTHKQRTFYAADHPKVLARLSSVPKAYADSKAQAAFEAVYRNRLYMLRGSEEIVAQNSGPNEIL